MTNQLTADEIDRLGAAATARPWADRHQASFGGPHETYIVGPSERIGHTFGNPTIADFPRTDGEEWNAQQEANAAFITALVNHSAEWSAALRENERLREALKPFAAICPGGLKDVGGGTLVKPSIKIQLIKNAREALGDSHE